MPNRLQGQCVAITRTPEQNRRLAALLGAEGAQVLEVPLIAFARTAQPGALHARLRHLAGLEWLLLTSPQAVTALLQELAACGLDSQQALDGIALAVVGRSTAQALQAGGLRANFMPSQAGARHLAAELPVQAGAQVLHLTSQRSEAALQEGLQRRGVMLERLELYRTLPTEPDAQQRFALQSADAVTLASGSAAQQLAALGFVHLPVAVMGPQTAQAAYAAGFTRVAQAQTATLEGLVDAVAALVQE